MGRPYFIAYGVTYSFLVEIIDCDLIHTTCAYYSVEIVTCDLSHITRAKIYINCTCFKQDFRAFRLHTASRSAHTRRMSQTWDATEAMERLRAEKVLDGIDLSSANQGEINQTTRRILREAAPIAAMALVHIVNFSPNERLRQQTAMYIIDRNLGRIGEMTSTDAKDPIEALIAQCLEGSI